MNRRAAKRLVTTRKRATLARSIRLLGEFRFEQSDPARFYGGAYPLGQFDQEIGLVDGMHGIQAQAVDPHVQPVGGMRPAAGLGDLVAADGYVATIVSGEIIAENGVPTAARPGRLVRGRQPAPA